MATEDTLKAEKPYDDSGTNTHSVSELSDAPAVDLSCRTEPGARRVLERWVRAGTTPQRLVCRSRIVLLMLDGVRTDEIAEHLGVARGTVRLWISRFKGGGPEALLHDAPGRGRHARLESQTMTDVLRNANLLDRDGRPISLRRAAAALGVSASAVWRAMKRSAQRTSKAPQDLCSQRGGASMA
jgi:transposase